jgi:hypothetical protein
VYTAAVANTLYWRLIPGVIMITVHTKTTPSDEDWDAYLEDVKKQATGIRGVLVYSESAGPTAPQRARISELYKALNIKLRTAIMSGSRLVRGVVTAMSWTLADDIKSFSTTEFDKAVEYLELSEDERLRAKIVLKGLARGASVEVAAFADESGRFAKKYKEFK